MQSITEHDNRETEQIWAKQYWEEEAKPKINRDISFLMKMPSSVIKFISNSYCYTDCGDEKRIIQ
jgi:hypothetical protein